MPKHDKKVTHLKGAKKLKKAEHLKYCKQEKAKQTKELKSRFYGKWYVPIHLIPTVLSLKVGEMFLSFGFVLWPTRDMLQIKKLLIIKYICCKLKNVAANKIKLLQIK